MDWIRAQEIPDSRGRPTVEVFLKSGDKEVVASVPSGKSTGSREALEKRDADGRGVKDVLKLLNEEVFPRLTAADFTDQRALDDFLCDLDGTENKSRLGANGILPVSIAYAKLQAASAVVPLWKFIATSEAFTPQFPHLYMNVLNGGAHADFCLPFQEYIFVLGGAPCRAYERGKNLFVTLGDRLHAEKGLSDIRFGDEGGYAVRLETLERPFEILAELMRGEEDIFLAIDAVAAEFAESDGYRMLGRHYARDALVDVYLSLMETFPLRSIEDPFGERDAAAFAKLLARAPEGTLVVGDDLTVTNPKVLTDIIIAHAANALIVKPNQIGTLTEVYDTIRMARKAGWKTIVSHRSGETTDSFIADLAVGTGAYGLKAGAPSQAVRVAKYERLLAIENEFSMLQ